MFLDCDVLSYYLQFFWIFVVHVGTEVQGYSFRKQIDASNITITFL